MVRVAQPMPAQFTSDLSGAHLDCGVHRADHLLGVGDVGLHEQAADLLGQRHALVLLEVRDHHAHAPLGEQT